MGVLSGIVKALRRGAKAAARGGDEAADATDASKLDETGQATDDAVRRSLDDASGAADDISAQGDSYARRLGLRATDRFVEGSTPAEIIGRTTPDLKGTAKVVGASSVTLGGIYVGGQVMNRVAAMERSKDKEEAYENYLAAQQAIRNNDDLTEEEKERALDDLRETYRQSWENPDGEPTGPFAGLFDGLGMVETAVIGFIIVAGIMAAGDAVAGGS